jgi:hypothetical protein
MCAAGKAPDRGDRDIHDSGIRCNHLINPTVAAL